MYGLDTEVINDLKDIFSKFRQIDSVILYGSRAKGNYRKGSDIDLTLLGEGLTLSVVYKIKNKIEDLNLPYEFDISIHKQIDNQKLKDHINRVGKNFYQKKTVLPKGWEVKKLGEVCEIKPPKRLAKEKLSESDLVTFFPMEDLKEFNHYIKPIKTKYLKDVYGGYVYFENNDVLLAKITPCFENGKLGIAKDLKNGIGFGSSEYMVFRPKVGILSEYIYYFLSLEIIRRKGKDRMTGAVGHKRIPVDYLSNQNLIKPPLSEQKRIVAILDKAFAAIAKAKANAEQNLKNTKELFESCLQTMFDNGKLKIENGEWKERALGEVCNIKPPKKEARDKLKETDVVTFLPMEDLGVLKKEIIGVKERQFKDVAGSYTYFANNDVLLAKITPCFENGKIGVARNLINGIGFGSSEYIIFRTNEEIEPDFLYYFLSRQQIREEGSKRMTGAVGHKRVSKEWIENYLFSFPKSKEEQQTIVKKFDALAAETKKLEAIYRQKTEELEELKKSVLQKVFNGEL